MLAYAPRTDRRRFHPVALGLILGAHAVAILAVMSARTEFGDRFEPTVTNTRNIPIDPEPEPLPPEPRPSNQPHTSQLDSPPSPLPPLPSDGPTVDPVPLPPIPPGPIGPTVDPLPPTPAVVRTGPRFATPDHLLKPPYPEDKRRLDQEATLKLRLSIDSNGRVTAVEPVGKADPAFLEAARRHIMRAWRYKPATEDGQPIASSTVITLKFELD